MFKRSHTLLLFITLLASTKPAFASADRDFKIIPSHINSGLPQQTVTSVIEDSAGFLWIGTQQGLIRYNGRYGRLYASNNIADTTAMNVRDIKEDNAGTIWISTWGAGISYYRKDLDQLETLGESSDRFPKFLTAITTDHRQHRLWFASKELGLGYYDPRSGSLRPISLGHEFGEAPYVYDLEFDDNGSLWIGTSEGLAVFDTSIDGDLFVEAPVFTKRLGPVLALKYDRQNELMYAATSNGQLQRVEATAKNIVSSFVWQANGQPITSDISIYENMLWLSTDNGLVTINPATGESWKFTSNTSDLSNSHTTTLFDGKDGLWVGTYAGLNLVNRSVFEKFLGEDYNFGQDVMSVDEDPERRLWIATYSGLFFRTQKSTEHFASSTILNAPLADDRVMVVRSHADILWVGMLNGGLQVFNLVSGNEFSVLEGQLPGSYSVTDILPLSPVSALFSTEKSGVYQATVDFSFEEPRVWARAIDEVPRETTILQIFEKSSGDTVLLAEDHLHWREGASDRFRKIDLEFRNHPSSRPEPLLYVAREATNGGLWFGTRTDGVYFARSKPKGGNTLKLEEVKASTDLMSPAVFAMEIDESDRAWIAGSSGLARIGLRESDIEIFHFEDGLQGREFNFGASSSSSKGDKLVFGGTKGYNVVHPKLRDRPPPPSSLVITDTKIGGRRPRESKHLSSDLIGISFMDEYLSVAVSLLDHTDNTRRHYRYKLENFDSDWIDNGNNHTITYTNLPEGNYVLRVQGANSAGVWNYDGLSVNVYVHPPPWNTIWAYFAYGALLITLAVMMKRVYDVSVLKEQAVLKARQMESAAEQALDTLQHEVEYHNELEVSLRSHTQRGLEFVQRILEQRFTDSPAIEGPAHREQGLERIELIRSVEQLIVSDGPRLTLNVHGAVDRIFEQVLNGFDGDRDAVITTNEVTRKPFTADIGVLIALITYELCDNAVRHAFSAPSSIYFLHVKLGLTGYADDDTPNWVLEVADNGDALQGLEISELPFGIGLRLVNDYCDRLAATLALIHGRDSVIFRITREQTAGDTIAAIEEWPEELPGA